MTCVFADINRLPSPQTEPYKQSGKRKQDSVDAVTHDEPPTKKDRTCSTEPSDGPELDDDAQQEVPWEDYFGQWPPLRRRNFSMSEHRGTIKRSRSRSSYTQSVRDGSSPAAWTRLHEEKMQKAGLIMTDYYHRATITEDCRSLCCTLLKKEYSLPEGSFVQPDRLAKMFDRVQFRNEARVVRDILPIVVPSPELLCIDGDAHLDYVCEAINAEWTQCDTLCGPRPKPNFVVGISPSAFAKDEIDKLRLSHTSECPNLFPESIYLPFLICEVGSDRPIQEAERQAMHSASIAVRAIIQLYQKASLIDEVDQRILAFSVAHDQSTVKFFGHFAKIDGDKITFFRYRLYFGDFAADLSSKEWAKGYHITRAIYEYFYPKHLARIKRALSNMRPPSLMSFTSQFGLDDSQDSTAESSSQEDGPFKKPSLPSSTMKLQQENEKLRVQLLETVRIMEQQMGQQKEQMEQQLAQQKEEAREQRILLERQLFQQKEQLERQLEQQKEIISLLKGTKST